MSILSDEEIKMVLAKHLSYKADDIVLIGIEKQVAQAQIDKLRVEEMSKLKLLFDNVFSFDMDGDDNVYLGFPIKMLKEIGEYPVTIMRGKNKDVNH